MCRSCSIVRQKLLNLQPKEPTRLYLRRQNVEVARTRYVSCRVYVVLLTPALKNIIPSEG